MNKSNPNNDPHKDTIDKESLSKKNKKKKNGRKMYDKAVAGVSETNKRTARHYYKEVSKKYNHIINRSF